MLLKSILPLLVSLALASPAEYFPDIDAGSVTSTTKFHTAAAAASSSARCKPTYTVTYEDSWGPLFTESRYICDFTDTSQYSAPPDPGASTASFRVPAPYNHPAGNHGNDPRVLPSHPNSYTQQLHTSLDKHTITSFGCAPLPSSRDLPRNKYSNLFWGIQQLTNQSCLAPGEAVEFVDLRRDWSADWRFTNVNRGHERMCDWYGELANIAQALHYFCFHTLGRAAEDEFSGGDEIVAFGRDSDREQRWCMRYSERGWGLDVFEEKCLGV